MKVRIHILISLFVLILSADKSHSRDISEYLILSDIGPYKIAKPEKLFPGEPPSGGPRSYGKSGIIAATGHFPDHGDWTYEVMYLSETDQLTSPTVQVTRHAGGESDKWLLHEVERGYRSEDLESQFEATIKEIDGNKFITWQFGRSYRWLSNNIVVHIEYVDAQLTKPEPLEVVSAYLALHPSTITLTDTEIKSRAYNEQWIKDEMDRRLWLGGKWIGKITNVGEERKKTLIRVVDHIYVFLDYREKYFGVGADSEKASLDVKLQAEDKDAIEAKLNEYYQWWTQNKTGAINLP